MLTWSVPDEELIKQTLYRGTRWLEAARSLKRALMGVRDHDHEVPGDASALMLTNHVVRFAGRGRSTERPLTWQTWAGSKRPGYAQCLFCRKQVVAWGKIGSDARLKKVYATSDTHVNPCGRLWFAKTMRDWATRQLSEGDSFIVDNWLHVWASAKKWDDTWHKKPPFWDEWLVSLPCPADHLDVILLEMALTKIAEHFNYGTDG